MSAPFHNMTDAVHKIAVQIIPDLDGRFAAFGIKLNKSRNMMNFFGLTFTQLLNLDVRYWQVGY